MSNLRLILIGLGLLVGGVIFAAVTFGNYREDQRLSAQGETVQGEVVGGSESRGRRGRRTYKVNLAYASKDGRIRREKEFKVDSSEYAKAEQQGTLPVTFLPSDPSVARVGGPRNTAVGMGIGSLMAVVGLGMLGWFVKRMRTPVAAQPAPFAGGPQPYPGGPPPYAGGPQPYPGGLPPIPPAVPPVPSGIPAMPSGVPPIPPGQDPAGGPPPPYSLPPR